MSLITAASTLGAVSKIAKGVTSIAEENQGLVQSASEVVKEVGEGLKSLKLDNRLEDRRSMRQDASNLRMEAAREAARAAANRTLAKGKAKMGDGEAALSAKAQQVESEVMQRELKKEAGRRSRSAMAASVTGAAGTLATMATDLAGNSAKAAGTLFSGLGKKEPATMTMFGDAPEPTHDNIPMFGDNVVEAEILPEIVVPMLEDTSEASEVVVTQAVLPTHNKVDDV